MISLLSIAISLISISSVTSAYITAESTSDSVSLQVESEPPPAFCEGGGYIIIASGLDGSPDCLRFLSLSCGFGCRVADLQQASDTASVKAMLFDTVSVYGPPYSIIILGDENAVSPYRERMNPYSQKRYPDDSYYGIFQEGEGFIQIPVSRIPAKDAESAELFSKKALLRISSAGVSGIVSLCPFYDADSDSAEDLLHFTLSWRTLSALESSFFPSLLSEAVSPCPKYFFDREEIPDSFMIPLYDWTVTQSDLAEKSSQSDLLLYRGHGNIKELVLPNFALSAVESGCLKCLSFASFACLTGAFDSSLSMSGRSFCESLLMSGEGPVAALAASSETFYQYNNLMYSLFADCLCDSAFSPVNTEQCLRFCDIVKSVKSSFIETASSNPYSEAQYYSYSSFGIPFLDIVTEPLPFNVISPDTIFSSSVSFSVSAPEGYSVYLHDGAEIIDSSVSAGGLASFDILGFKTGREYYVSSYCGGRLALDTFFLMPGSVSVENAHLAESGGDGDSIVENMEESLFLFDLFSGTDGDIMLKFVFDGFLPSADSAVFSVENGFCSCSLSGTVSADEYITASVYCGGSLYRFSLPAEARRVSADSIIKQGGGFIMTGETETVELFFSRGEHLYDSLFLKLIGSCGCSCMPFDTMLSISAGSASLSLEALFSSSEPFLMIEAYNNLMCETLMLRANPVKRNSILIADPLMLYDSSDFVIFLQDSLQTDVFRTDSISQIQGMRSVFIAAGVFPYTCKIEDDDVHSILSALSEGSLVYLEGGDALGYDRAGSALWGPFGMISASDGDDIQDGADISDSLFGRNFLCDTVIRYADTYITDTPYLIIMDSAKGAWTESTLCSSVPLRSVKCEDMHAFYYEFISNLCRFGDSASFPPSLNLRTYSSLVIENRGDSPLMLSILSIPQFIDSAVICGGRFLLPDSSSTVNIFHSSVPPGKSGTLKFSTGISEHSVRIYSSSLEYTKSAPGIRYRNGKLEIFAQKGSLLTLPSSAKWGLTAERTENGFTIEGDLFLLSGKTLSVSSGGEVYWLVVPDIPMERSKSGKNGDDLYFYDILGAKRKRRESQGILFSKNGKIIYIR